MSMFDFPIMPEVAPKFAWIISGALYFMILAIYYRWAFYRQDITKHYSRVFSLVVLVFLFCLIAIYCGDWVHLQIIVKEIVGTEYIEGKSIEKLYYYLANILNGNYLLFRTIVWGAGLSFMMYAFKQASLDPYRCLFFLFGCYITLFAYSRAGAAHASFFCGLILLFKDRNIRGFQSFFIGIVLLALSFFLHRSMLVLIILAPLAIIPFNRHTFLLVLVGVVVISFIWRGLFEDAMGVLMNSDEYAYRIELYEDIAGGQVFSFDKNGLFFLWYKGIIHIPYWYCSIQIYRRINLGLIPQNIQAVFRFSFFLYIFTIMMLFMYGSASAFYYRYESMLYIPITIMATYLFQKGYIQRNKYTLMFWFCALSQCKDFIYRIFFI